MFARPSQPHPRPRALGYWLLLVAALVFAIVIVGGITRLTESGLSITEWKPIRGIIPPLNAAQWEAEFAGYRRIPQYAHFNAGMTLAGFKAIYFWEYAHRALARAIGLVLVLVMLGFWWKRAIPAGYGRRMLALLALGGLQGAIGWWMVASGLQYRVEVSHIRLATHLLAALLIYAVLLWTVLDLFLLARASDAGHAPDTVRARMPGYGLLVLALLALQLVYGAFTAGLRAGYAFAEWPTMGGKFFPDGVPFLSPAWTNLVYQPIVVQFVHRWLAWVVAAFALGLAAWAWRRGARGAAVAVAAALACQIGLGIETLLSGVRIDIAVAHQGMAALLLAALLTAAHAVGTPRITPPEP